MSQPPIERQALKVKMYLILTCTSSLCLFGRVGCGCILFTRLYVMEVDVCYEGGKVIVSVVVIGMWVMYACM